MSVVIGKKCQHRARINEQKPNGGKKSSQVSQHRQNKSFKVSTCVPHLFLSESDLLPRCKNRTDLSSDEVELGVTLHTSRALEDGKEGKQDVTQHAELGGFWFNGSSE